MEQKIKLAFFIYFNTFNQSDHMDTPKHNNTCILPCFPQRALPSAVNQNNTYTCEYLHSFKAYQYFKYLHCC